jgi:hypothetical protein
LNMCWLIRTHGEVGSRFCRGLDFSKMVGRFRGAEAPRSLRLGPDLGESAGGARNSVDSGQ